MSRDRTLPTDLKRIRSRTTEVLLNPFEVTAVPNSPPSIRPSSSTYPAEQHGVTKNRVQFTSEASTGVVLSSVLAGKGPGTGMNGEGERNHEEGTRVNADTQTVTHMYRFTQNTQVTQHLFFLFLYSYYN